MAQVVPPAPPSDDASIALVVERIARVAGMLVAAVGAFVLLGWAAGSGFLKSVVPGLISMKVNTALCFLAAGVAVAGVARRDLPAVRRRGTRVLSLFVLVLGGATLLQYATGRDFGIDQWLAPDDPGAAETVHPGRMAPATAVGFLLAGISLLALSFSRGSALWHQIPATLVHLVGLVALVGYAYDVRNLYRFEPWSSMALHTSAALWLLGIALLAARPRRGFVGVLVRPTLGGYLARRLVPTLPVALLLLGFACLAGIDAGWWRERIGFSLLVVLATVVTWVLVAWQASAIHRVDVGRRRAEAELASWNAGLEARVRERTRDLEEALAQVKRLQGLLPICAWCKRIRDDNDYWHSVETYVSERSEAQFSHAMCPDCYARERAAMSGGPSPARD